MPGADHLARIFGTEDDKVNCPFYYKIGACRHGERCSRVHMRPNFSQTVLVPHFYRAPAPDANGQPVDDKEDFQDFYEDVLDEIKDFGEVEEMHVIDNLGDHMLGNVYIKFRKEEEAEACLKALGGRYYSGQLLIAEYSPVTDFREARCRQYDEGTCGRGGYCNFMHMRKLPGFLRRKIKKMGRKRRRSPRRDRDRDSRRRDDRDRDSRRRDDKDRDRSSRRSDRDRDSRRSRSDRGDDREKSSSSAGRSERSDSAERRAKIAMWNKKRDEAKQEGEKAAEAGAADDAAAVAATPAVPAAADASVPPPPPAAAVAAAAAQE